MQRQEIGTLEIAKIEQPGSMSCVDFEDSLELGGYFFWVYKFVKGQGDYAKDCINTSSMLQSFFMIIIVIKCTRISDKADLITCKRTQLAIMYGSFDMGNS